LRTASVEQFETACSRSGVEHSIHHDRNIAIKELLHESIYADLLVISSRETLTHYNEKLPTRFIRDLLRNAQCPVLIVPPTFSSIDNLVLLFDGQPSSVHAIKMFSYCLDALKQYPTSILNVKEKDQSSHIPDNRLMKEFMRRHFPLAEFKVLKGDPGPAIVNYLEDKDPGSLIVLGAYGRNAASGWFRESMADILLKDLKVPLFIAHHK
jgi:nucleotide-binding universal stress UspA family protein